MKKTTESIEAFMEVRDLSVLSKEEAKKLYRKTVDIVNEAFKQGRLLDEKRKGVELTESEKRAFDWENTYLSKTIHYYVNEMVALEEEFPFLLEDQ